MRLINTTTLRLSEFFGDAIPEYAILSHTWGDEEVDFRTWYLVQEFDGEQASPSAAQRRRHRTAWLLGGARDDPMADEVQRIKNRAGTDKVLQAAKRAAADGYAWVWVDTCCIDKSSSAELSEAINSMFQWYFKAAVCYAYLVDVPPCTEKDCEVKDSAFRKSRWFTRGWTLQELIAPEDVEFFASDWSPIMTRRDALTTLEEVTGVSYWALNGTTSMQEFSIAERMSWASKRRTTRLEDRAYCLLGIFGVHMPLLYGEGEHAFLRLQEEIIKYDPDSSFLSWNFPGRESGYFIDAGRWSYSLACNVLATSPSAFDAGSSLIARYAPSWLEEEWLDTPRSYAPSWSSDEHEEAPPEPTLYFMYPHSITNLGLRMSRPLIATLATGVSFVALSSSVTGADLANGARDEWMPVHTRRWGNVENRYERLRFPAPTVTVQSKELREAMVALKVASAFRAKHKAQEIFVALQQSDTRMIVAPESATEDIAATGVLVTLPTGRGRLGQGRQPRVWPAQNEGILHNPCFQLYTDIEASCAYGYIGMDLGEGPDTVVLFFADVDVEGKPVRWTCRVLLGDERWDGPMITKHMMPELYPDDGENEESKTDNWRRSDHCAGVCAAVLEPTIWTGLVRDRKNRRDRERVSHTLLAHILFPSFEDDVRRSNW